MSTKKSVQVLLLTQKAEVKEVALVTAANGSITLPMVQALLKKKEVPTVLGNYKFKSQYLYLVGYTTGKAGTENKHELPPPYDSTSCFGDIVLLATKDSKNWTTPVPLKMSDYETFYTRAFGGFEGMDSDDDEEEVEEAEAEAEVEEAEVEEAEVEEEEEDEEVNEIVECDEGVEIEAEVVAPFIKKRGKRAVVAPVTGGAAQVYSTYLYVAPEEELHQEDFDAPYDPYKLNAERTKNIHALKGLFAQLLSEKEVYELERCIYNMAIRTAMRRHIGRTWSYNPFVEMYFMEAKHISANLHPEAYVKNTELFAKYKAGEVSFKEISEMDSYQLFEERWKDSFLQQQIREKRQLEGNMSMATDRFLCKRCGKRQCTYYELQTRSADEPMTVFITCLNCGKHWRQ
jgi:DNA-directed RNA polymerase subunit M/transcription elongation factor TFIIS